MTQYRDSTPQTHAPWGPLAQLQRDMSALLEGRRAPSAAPMNWRGAYPPVNCYDTHDAFILMAEVPGVEPGDIHVSLRDSTLTIHGERKIALENLDDASIHRRERQTGNFKRTFALPQKVDGDKVEAAQKNGVLMVRIPKSPEAQPRQVSVVAG